MNCILAGRAKYYEGRSDKRAASLLDSLTFRVCDITVAVLPRLAEIEDPLNADLNDFGLTSVEAVLLLMEIEKAFEVVVPDEDMTPENFSSIARLAAMLLRLKRVDA